MDALARIDVASPISSHALNRRLVARWSSLVGAHGNGWVDLVTGRHADAKVTTKLTVDGYEFGASTTDHMVIDKDYAPSVINDIGDDSFSVVIRCLARSSGGGGSGTLIERDFVSGATGWVLGIRDTGGNTDAWQALTGMSTTDANSISNDSTVIYDEWITMAFVWERGSNTRNGARRWSIYQNGVLLPLATEVTGNPEGGYGDDSASVFRIGNEATTTTRNWDGYISDVIILRSRLNAPDAVAWHQELSSGSPLTLNRIGSGLSMSTATTCTGTLTIVDASGDGEQWIYDFGQACPVDCTTLDGVSLTYDSAIGSGLSSCNWSSADLTLNTTCPARCQDNPNCSSAPPAQFKVVLDLQLAGGGDDASASGTYFLDYGGCGSVGNFGVSSTPCLAPDCCWSLAVLKPCNGADPCVFECAGFNQQVLMTLALKVCQDGAGDYILGVYAIKNIPGFDGSGDIVFAKNYGSTKPDCANLSGEDIPFYGWNNSQPCDVLGAGGNSCTVTAA